jgi:DUF3052 family protein
MAGYSATPLWKKLGFKSGVSAFVQHAPANYQELLGLPDDVVINWEPKFKRGLPFLHIFVTHCADLKSKLIKYREWMDADGVVWISWPKKSSGVKTDVTEDRIRELALPTGLVDIKVCAVDETWSGLKLMIRKEER